MIPPLTCSVAYSKQGRAYVGPTHAVCHLLQVPLLIWCVALIIIYGVSFDRVKNLQGPLTSLDVAAHVIYRLSRVN